MRRQGWMNTHWQSSGTGTAPEHPDYHSGYVLVPCKIYTLTNYLPDAFRIRDGGSYEDTNHTVYPEGYEDSTTYINTPLYMKFDSSWTEYPGGAFGPHYEASLNVVIPDIITAHTPRIPASGLNGSNWTSGVKRLYWKIIPELPSEWRKYYNPVISPGYYLGYASTYGVTVDFGIWSSNDEYIDLKTSSDSILDIAKKSGPFSYDFPNYQYWPIKNATSDKLTAPSVKTFELKAVTSGSTTIFDLIYDFKDEDLCTIPIAQSTIDTFTGPTIFAYRLSTGSGLNPYEKPVIV